MSTLWATGALYSDNYKQLRACGLASPCPTPTEVDTGAASVSALTYYDGKHYGASGASGGGNVIFSVSDTTPVAARALLVSDAAGVADVAVDASGIYWVNGMTGKVLRCATLTGCAGRRRDARDGTGGRASHPPRREVRLLDDADSGDEGREVTRYSKALLRLQPERVVGGALARASRRAVSRSRARPSR